MTDAHEERQKWDRLAEACPGGLHERGVQLVEDLEVLFHSLEPGIRRVLEAGCGSGLTGIELANRGFQVDLLDFSPRMLDKARQACAVYLAERSPAPGLFCTDLSEASLEVLGVEPYDCVFSVGMLEHYEDDEVVGLLKRMSGLSRGYVAVMVPNSRCPAYRFWRWLYIESGAWPYGKEVPRTTLTPLLERAGLEPVVQSPMGRLAALDLAKELGQRQADFLRWFSSDDLPEELSSYLICSVGRVRQAGHDGNHGSTQSADLAGLQQARIERLQTEERRLSLALEEEGRSRALAEQRAAEIYQAWRHAEELLGKLQGRLEEVERTVASERTNRIEAGQQVSRLGADLEAARDELQLEKEARLRSEERAEELARESAESKDELLLARQDVSRLEKEVEESRAESRRLNEARRDSEQLVSRLERDLERSTGTLRLAREALLAAQQQSRQLEGHLAQSREDVKQLDRERQEALTKVRRLDWELKKSRDETYFVNLTLGRIYNSIGFRAVESLRRLRDRCQFLSATHEIKPLLKNLVEAVLCWFWRVVLPESVRIVLDARAEDHAFHHHDLRVFTKNPQPWEERFYATADTRLPPHRHIQVTLISTVYNEAGNAQHWMRSIAAQTRHPDEVIIVDGGSSDATVEILRGEGLALPCPVLVLVEPGCNIARGRNIAIRKAKHEFIASTDAGGELKPDWLEELVAPFEHDETVDAVVGWCELHPDSSAWTRNHAWLFWRPLEGTDPKELLPSSRSFAFLKSQALRIGGYPEHLTRWAEDTLFCLNLTGTGTHWAFAPEAVVHWFGPGSWRAFLKLRRNYCLGNGEARIMLASGGLAAREVLTLTLLIVLTAGLFAGAAFSGTLIWAGIAGAALSLLYAWKSSPTQWVRKLTSRRPRRGGNLLAVAESWCTRAADCVGTIQGLWRSRRVVLRRVLDVNLETFVFLPSHEWFWMKQRPGHIAEALARRGFQVVYCPNNESEQIHGGLLKVADRIVLCNDTQYLRALKRPIVYSAAAHHFAANRALVPPKARIVFDLIDDVEATNSSESDLRIAVQAAEVTCVSARRLEEYVLRKTGKAPLLLPNAVNYDDWRPRGHRPPPDLAKIRELGPMIVGYTGAVGYWLDFELLAAAALARPAWQFVLIGPAWNDEVLERALALPGNVHHLGLKHYSELPAYVENFTVAIIPFQIFGGTLAASPIKLYEYAAMEAPVVSTDLPECRSHDVVHIARSVEELIGAIETAAAQREDPAVRTHLRELALANSWDQRVDLLVGRLGLGDRYPAAASGNQEEIA